MNIFLSHIYLSHEISVHFNNSYSLQILTPVIVSKTQNNVCFSHCKNGMHVSSTIE